MTINNYINQNMENPTFLFHGSPRLFEIVERRLSNSSDGNAVNIDNAVFTTSSFLVASAYAFKDTIKANSSGLHYNFNINYDGTFPIMEMENVNINEEIYGYVYVFKNEGNFKNEPVGSLQYKSHNDIKPIDIVKIYYKDYMQYYENKGVNKTI